MLSIYLIPNCWNLAHGIILRTQNSKFFYLFVSKNMTIFVDTKNITLFIYNIKKQNKQKKKDIAAAILHLI